MPPPMNMPFTMELFVEALQNVMASQKAGPYGALQPAIQPSGYEITWSQYADAVRNGRIKSARIDGTGLALKGVGNVTLGSAPMYGCSGVFGLCGPDDVLGLSMLDDPLVAWLGFTPDTICERFVKVLSYIDQAGTAAGSLSGHVYGSPCDDPPTTEKDFYEIPWGDFGVLRCCGNGVPLTIIGKRKCDKQPVYTLPIEGVGMVRIDNDLVLEELAAAQCVKHAMSRLIITGDEDTQYQFDGLQQIVNTGYVDTKGHRRYSTDSIVVDWQNDNMDGAVNGHGNIVWKVKDIWRRIRWRIKNAAKGMPREGDVALVMPSWMAPLFLDAWAYATLWTGGVLGNQVIHDNLAMREFRDRFNGGLYGGGFITIDGFNIHILEHDWLPIDQSAPYFCADIYFLVRRLGGQRIFMGQYMPLDLGANAANRLIGSRYYTISTMKQGRFLKWTNIENACVEPCMLISPRLWCIAPWAQARIDNVCVSVQFDPLSPDPQSDYWIEPTQEPDELISQYWYDTGGWFH